MQQIKVSPRFGVSDELIFLAAFKIYQISKARIKANASIF
jgi:hypothetical protein